MSDPREFKSFLLRTEQKLEETLQHVGHLEGLFEGATNSHSVAMELRDVRGAVTENSNIVGETERAVEAIVQALDETRGDARRFAVDLGEVRDSLAVQGDSLTEAVEMLAFGLREEIRRLEQKLEQQIERLDDKSSDSGPFSHNTESIDKSAVHDFGDRSTSESGPTSASSAVAAAAAAAAAAALAAEVARDGESTRSEVDILEVSGRKPSACDSKCTEFEHEEHKDYDSVDL